MSSKSPKSPKSEILSDVQKHYKRFIAFENPHHATIMSLWTLHTWAFDAAFVTPYIYVSSVDPGAGKSTLMETAVDLVRSPDMSAGTSPAALYRSLVEDTPTIILDEVDAIYSGAKNEDLRRVLNSGYKHNGAERRFIDGESVSFPTFCPKLLGGIDNGQVPETVMSRAIRIRLRRLSSDALAEAGVEERDYTELAMDGSIEKLQKEIAAWATVDTVEKIKFTKPERIEGLSARQWEISRPLLAIAKHLGDEAAAREALVAVFKGEEVETDEVRVLKVAREVFDTIEGDRLTTAQLTTAAGFDTPDRLGRMLAKIGLKPKAIRVAGRTARGWYRNDFEAAWERFL